MCHLFWTHPYVLLEHQSSVDPLMAHRLLRYMVRIWDSWLADHRDARHLPAIVPMLIYQAGRPWSAPVEFHALVAGAASLHPGLRPFTPSFRYALIELRAVGDDALGADAVALALKVMKHAQAVDFLARLTRFAAEFRVLLDEPSRLRLLEALVHYLLEVRDAAETVRALQLITDAAGPEVGDAAMNAAEQLREEGRREGREEGRREGRQEGRREGRREGLEEGARDAERELLTRLLVMRFGPLEQGVHERLVSSTAAQRRAWSERLFDAADLDAVFDSDPEQ